jgi:signal transduction histidine kinase
MADSTSERADERRVGPHVSHGLLHALIEALDRRAMAVAGRRREIARALEIFTAPAAVFDIAVGRPAACNRAWSAELGKTQPPSAVRGSLAAAARERADPHVVAIELRGHRYVATTQSLARRGALVTLHDATAARWLHPNAAFLATIAHSLRGPLAATLMWERALRDRDLDCSGPREALDAIRESTLTELRLIKQLLEFVRAETRTLQLDTFEVDLVAVMAAATLAASPTAAAASIALHAAQHARPIVVHGDPVQLRQVIDQLLSNALKYTPAGGSIAIAIRKRQRRASIEIADTGRGIASDLAQQIFDPMAIAREARCAGDGLRIGLAICKHVVELHGGTLVATSAGIGTGATFTISLPLARSASRSRVRVRRMESAAGSVRIGVRRVTRSAEGVRLRARASAMRASPQPREAGTLRAGKLGDR